MDRHGSCTFTTVALYSLYEQVSVKFLTATGDRLVVLKGWKSPKFSNLIVQTVSTNTQLDKKLDKYVDVVLPCLVVIGASRYLWTS